MTTPSTQQLNRTTDEVLDIWRESQETAATAWRRWADSVQSVTPASFATWTSPGAAQWPNPRETVDAAFDLAQEVLATQRRFLKEWIDATNPVVETARRQSGEVARATEKTARRAQSTAKALSTPDYASMTVEELQDHAAKADLEGRSAMNKDQLVKALSKR